MLSAFAKQRANLQMIQADDKGFIVFTRRNTRDRQLILSEFAKIKEI